MLIAILLNTTLTFVIQFHRQIMEKNKTFIIFQSFLIWNEVSTWNLDTHIYK